MNMLLSVNEYKNIDRKMFAKNIKDYIIYYFESNYGDAIFVKDIQLNDYFKEIDTEIERYSTIGLPTVVITNSTIFIKVVWRKVDIIDDERFGEINKNLEGFRKFSWQQDFYNEMKIFFDFYGMPKTIFSFNIESDFTNYWD